MATIEGFSDVAASSLASSDFIYFRRSAQPAGSRDARFSFSAIMRGLLAAVDNPSARAAIGFVTATASLDFPNIGAAASSDLTMAVAGAAVGDAVILGLPSAPTSGLIFQGWVSATNVVKIRASNITGSGIDMGAMTFRAVVLKST